MFVEYHYNNLYFFDGFFFQSLIFNEEGSTWVQEKKSQSVLYAVFNFNILVHWAFNEFLLTFFVYFQKKVL